MPCFQGTRPVLVTQSPHTSRAPGTRRLHRQGGRLCLHRPPTSVPLPEFLTCDHAHGTSCRHRSPLEVPPAHTARPRTHGRGGCAVCVSGARLGAEGAGHRPLGHRGATEGQVRPLSPGVPRASPRGATWLQPPATAPARGMGSFPANPASRRTLSSCPRTWSTGRLFFLVLLFTAVSLTQWN